MTEPHSSPDTVTSEPERASGGGNPRGFDIFISYRVEPDEKLAAAVKRFIEASFTPAPNVFASGVGGILPSNHGYRTQIEAAARQARAFIGIITKASLNREWIFFEAGAAWGRNALYAPLLIDTDFSDLPTTIGAYQAIRASDPRNVRQLFEELGRTVGVELKSQFQRRFQSFEEVIKAYPRDPVKDDEPSLEALIDLLCAARYDDAEQMASAFKQRADDFDKARAEVILVACDERLKTPEKLIRLHEMTETLQPPVPNLYYNIAMLEQRPHVRLKNLTRCLDLVASGPLRQLAICDTASLMAKFGRVSEANASLRTLILSSDPSDRSSGAWAQFELLDKGFPVIQLSLLLIAIAGEPSGRHFREALNLTREERWHALGLYLAQKYQREFSDAHSLIFLGLILESADMPNLAYQAYSDSAEKGISVSKANMASLAMNQGLVAPGLAIMKAHEGEFDAAHPDYPYAVRRELEQRMRSERETHEKSIQIGEIQFELWLDLAECCMKNDAPPSFPHTLQIDNKIYKSVSTSPNTIILSPQKKPEELGEPGHNVEMLMHPCIPGLWYSNRGEALLVGLCGDAPRGLRITGAPASVAAVRVDVQLVPVAEKVTPVAAAQVDVQLAPVAEKVAPKSSVTVT